METATRPILPVLLWTLAGLVAALVAPGLILGLALIGLYFLPGIVAQRRNHPQQNVIWAINVLLGWTFVGWAAPLAYAFWESET